MIHYSMIRPSVSFYQWIHLNSDFLEFFTLLKKHHLKNGFFKFWKKKSHLIKNLAEKGRFSLKKKRIWYCHKTLFNEEYKYLKIIICRLLSILYLKFWIWINSLLKENTRLSIILYTFIRLYFLYNVLFIKYDQHGRPCVPYNIILA